MRIRIDKSSEITIHRQLAEQIVFQIATGRIKAEEPLPSVRELALRLKVSPTTVSEVYRELVGRRWIKRHRGKKMVVRPHDRPLESGLAADLDDLIDATVRKARERGYTLQALRNRVRQRLLIEHPDHVLVVEDEPGMRMLLQAELSRQFPAVVDSISIDMLESNPGQAIGALVVCIPGRVWSIAELLPRGHPMCGLEPSDVEIHLRMIGSLKESSVIGVVSVSPLFLGLARTLLAPVVGNAHAIEEYLLETDSIVNLSGIDVVFCDTASKHRIKARRVIHYRLISDAAVREILHRIPSLEGKKWPAGSDDG